MNIKKANIFKNISSITLIKYVYIGIFISTIVSFVFLLFFIKTNVYAPIYSDKKEDIIIGDEKTTATNIVQFSKLEKDIKKIEENLKEKTRIRPIINFKDVFNN